jgi:hypothetical protein
MNSVVLNGIADSLEEGTACLGDMNGRMEFYVASRSACITMLWMSLSLGSEMIS